MASAKIITYVPPPEPDFLVLTLTRKEAQFIRSMLGNIGSLSKTGQAIYDSIKLFSDLKSGIDPFYNITPYLKPNVEELIS